MSRPPYPAITVFFGMTATGKSTLAAAWAERITGRYLNSDRVRKELAGLAATDRRPDGVDQGIYTPEFSRRTYDELLRRAAAAVADGVPAVLDGSYQRAAERARVVDLARRLGVRVHFVHCVCPEEVIRHRLQRRAQDPAAVSDGRWEIYLAQKERFEEPTELDQAACSTLDTNHPLEDLLATLETRLGPHHA